MLLLEDKAMRYDFSPLYRSTVGFDRVFDMLDQATRVEPMANWPPYNIEKLGEDRYRITMAVAGFAPERLSRNVWRGWMAGARCDSGRLSKPVWTASCGPRPPVGGIAASTCVTQAM